MKLTSSCVITLPRLTSMFLPPGGARVLFSFVALCRMQHTLLTASVRLQSSIFIRGPVSAVTERWGRNLRLKLLIQWERLQVCVSQHQQPACTQLQRRRSPIVLGIYDPTYIGTRLDDRFSAREPDIWSLLQSKTLLTGFERIAQQGDLIDSSLRERSGIRCLPLGSLSQIVSVVPPFLNFFQCLIRDSGSFLSRIGGPFHLVQLSSSIISVEARDDDQKHRAHGFDALWPIFLFLCSVALACLVVYSWARSFDGGWRLLHIPAGVILMVAVFGCIHLGLRLLGE